MQVYPQIQLSELKLYFHSKITHTQPFNDPLSGTTQVGRYEKKHSPTHTNPDHQTSFINFLHLLWSTASSLFNLRECQSFSTTSLPLGLGPSTSHYIHFFTQSLSSFITNAHTITAKLMARISKHCQKDIQSIQFNTHTHPFNGPLSGTTQVSWYQKVKPMWILLKQDTVSGRGISWAICKSAPRSRQITMPAPHHSVFYRPDALPATQTNSVKTLKFNCSS